MIKRIGSLLIIFFLSACSTPAVVQKADSAYEINAKNFTTPSDRSRVYFIEDADIK